MQKNAYLFLAKIVFIGVLSLPLSAFAATAAGTVIVSTGSLTAQGAQGGSRSLSRGSPVYQADVVHTGANTNAEIRFTDGTLLALRSNSSVTINHYNYTPKQQGAATKSYQYAVNLTQGGLRTISGAIAKAQPSNFKTSTSVATIGVRGTDFSAVYDSNGGCFFGACQNKITLTNQAGTIELDANGSNRYAYIASATSKAQTLKTQPMELSSICGKMPSGAGAPPSAPPAVTPPRVAPRVPRPPRNFIPPEAFMGPPVPAPISFSGFYFGVGAAEATLHSRVTARFSHNCNSPADTSSIIIENFFSTNINSNNQYQVERSKLSGLLNLGYGRVLNDSRLYLGGEVTASVVKQKLNSHETSGNAIAFATFAAASIFHVLDNQKISNDLDIHLKDVEYGVVLRPGILIAPKVLTYVRMGLVFNRVKVNARNTLDSKYTALNNNNAPVGGIDLVDTLNTQASKDLTGLQLGAGIEYEISSRLSVFADYRHNSYHSITMHAQGAGTCPGITFCTCDQVFFVPNTHLNSSSYDGRVRLNGGVINLGLNFRF